MVVAQESERNTGGFNWETGGSILGGILFFVALILMIKCYRIKHKAGVYRDHNIDMNVQVPEANIIPSILVDNDVACYDDIPMAIIANDQTSANTPLPYHQYY